MPKFGNRVYGARRRSRRKREQELLSRSLTDIQFAGGLSHPADALDGGSSVGAASSSRQYKWTGSQQLYRDNPKELWRANPPVVEGSLADAGVLVHMFDQWEVPRADGS